MICSVEEAAQTLRTTPRRIRRMCETGQLSALKCGRAWLVEIGADPDRRRDDRKTDHRDVVR